MVALVSASMASMNCIRGLMRTTRESSGLQANLAGCRTVLGYTGSAASLRPTRGTTRSGYVVWPDGRYEYPTCCNRKCRPDLVAQNREQCKISRSNAEQGQSLGRQPICFDHEPTAVLWIYLSWNAPYCILLRKLCGAWHKLLLSQRVLCGLVCHVAVCNQFMRVISFRIIYHNLNELAWYSKTFLYPTLNTCEATPRTWTGKH